MNKKLVLILLSINILQTGFTLQADSPLQKFAYENFKIQKSSKEQISDINTKKLPIRLTILTGLASLIGAVSHAYAHKSNSLTNKKAATITATGAIFGYALGKIYNLCCLHNESRETLDLQKAQASLRNNAKILNILETERNAQNFVTSGANQCARQSNYAHLALEAELDKSITALEETSGFCYLALQTNDKLTDTEKTTLNNTIQASSNAAHKAGSYLLYLRSTAEFKSEKKQKADELAQAELLATAKAQRQTAQAQTVAAYAQTAAADAQHNAALAAKKESEAAIQKLKTETEKIKNKPATKDAAVQVTIINAQQPTTNGGYQVPPLPSLNMNTPAPVPYNPHYIQPSAPAYQPDNSVPNFPPPPYNPYDNSRRV